MTFVVPRRGGRFEIRESIHTTSGPRARTLANFAVLTEVVLSKAAQRSLRPFDRDAVITSARRSGAPILGVEQAGAGSPASSRQAGDFVGAATRFASLAGDGRPRHVEDPGATLVQLLRFAEEVQRHSPRRHLEPLTFPVLSRATARALET